MFGLGDLNRNNPRGEAGSHIPLLGYGASLSSPEEIRKESFWDMLTYVFCPFFTVKSFIFYLTIIDLLIYALVIAFDFNSERFLYPTAYSLDVFGAKNAYKLKYDLQVWRWATPLLLHGNLIHLIYNVIMQMIMGFRLEPTVGIKKTFIVYLVSGIGGNLLSAVVSPHMLSVGSSGAIFGLMTSMIAYLIMMWDQIPDETQRNITLIWLAILLVLNMLLGYNSQYVDNYCHLGGAAIGLALGLYLFCPSPELTATQTLLKKASFTLLICYFLAGFIVFYAVIEPPLLS